MSSVDDPEKHFLGNLLEDDPQSSLGPSSSGSGSATNANTTTTNTNNNNNNNNNNNIISPAFRPIGSSLVWPEPPPPYSPPLAAEPWLNGSMSDWFTSYNQDRKDSIGNGSSTLPGDSLLSFNLTNSGSSTIGESTPHIHHFHHNLHHHTHTHNVVQNHYFTTTPSSILTTTDLFGGDSPSLSSAPWNYAGIGSFGGEPVSSGCQISFSDWKNEVLNGGPQQKQSRLPPSPPPEASASPSPPPLSSSSIQSSNANQIEERKQQDVLKTYADASSKSTSRAKKSAIGCEKKQKQDLAKKLNNNPPTRIVVNGQPHSAPVITKMPFSYRDVAARVDNVSTNLPFIDGKEGSPVTRKNSIISSDTRSLKINNNTLSEKSMKKTNVSNRENVKSSSSLSTIAMSSSENRLREQKTRAPDVNQFQTITGKTPKVTTTGIVVAAAHQPPIMIPDAPSVKAPTRYDVLSSLESLKPRQRNGKKSRNDRAPVIEEVFSRSSSPDDEDEIMGSQEESVDHQIRKPISPKIARSISKGRGTNANIQNLTRKELKKQKVQQSQKGRQKRKVEPHWTDRMFWRIYNVLLIVLSYASSLFQWIIQLVVDDCLKIYDVVLFSTEAMFHGAWNAIKKTIYYIFILILYVFLSSWVFLRSITFTRIIEQLIYEDQPEIFEWGCRRELPVPSTAAEFIERLMREETHDAYVVLGLRSDCSDDDIKRNFKRICALVSPDKCTLEGAEDAFDLVNRAFDAIGNAESRANYTMNNAYNNEDHKFVISAWDDLRDHIEELRCTILCDCGQRHMRVSTTIRPSEARYCRRCDTMHPAKQNDIWVEKRIFGFRSVWFTCSDNVVYDISEWAMCERQRGLLKNMRVHTHSVQYRLVSPPANGELDFLTNSSTPSELASSSTASSGVGSAGGGSIVGGIQHEGRFFGEVQDEMLRHQRTLAQISFKTCEPREEDRSRRAANRRQKRWRN